MSLTKEQIEDWRDAFHRVYSTIGVKISDPALKSAYAKTHPYIDQLCDMALRSLDAPPSATAAIQDEILSLADAMAQAYRQMEASIGDVENRTRWINAHANTRKRLVTMLAAAPQATQEPVAIMHMHKYAAPSSAVTEETAITPLERLAVEILEDHRETCGDIDGAWIQDRALALGLLKSVTRTEPCGEVCACASVEEFPLECLEQQPDVISARKKMGAI